MNPALSLEEILGSVELRQLRGEGLQLRALRLSVGNRFPALAEDLYRLWRNGSLEVLRNWGGLEQEASTVAYSSRACLLPEDRLRLVAAPAPSSLVIATWNVNSIRSRMTLLLDWLKKREPDVVCLQETKVEDSGFPAWELEQAGYQCVWFGQKTYNGVAILSRQPLEGVKKGFSNSYDAENARLISATLHGIRIYNVYVPQGQSLESEKFYYQLRFLEVLLVELKTTCSPEQPVLMLGDFNIAPEPGDVADPDAMRGRVSFHPNEHARLEQFRKWGLVDLFRKFETREHQFSWWDFRTRGFERGEGLRIDLILASASAATRGRSCHIDIENRAEEKPSDHAPVLCEINL